MTRILPIILFTALSFCAISQNKTDLETSNFRGNVKSVESKSYRSSMVDGKIQLAGITVESFDTYNKEGYLTSNAFRFYTRILGKGAWKKSTNTLNDKNQIITSTYTKDSVLVEKTINTYRNDTLVQIKRLDDKGNTLSNVKQSYNKEGLLAESFVQNSSGVELEKTTFHYDRQGKIAITIKWKGETMDEVIKYTYTGINTSTTLTTNGKGQWKNLTITQRNDNNQIIRIESKTKENKSKGKTINEYDQFGNLVLRRIYDADGKEEEHNYMKYEYTFDKNNNWIQKIEYLHNGNSLDVTKRTIVYY